MSEGAYTTRVTERFLTDPSIPTRDVITRLLLYDFVTGNDTVLREHKRAIDRYVIRVAQGLPRMHVWIGGLASRAGGEGMNRGLSIMRARSVYRYIGERAPSLLARGGGATVRSFGEGRSTHGTDNSMYYRAVLIILSRAPAQDLRLPPRDRAPLEHADISTRFRIKLDHGVEVGEIMSIARFQFLIDYDVNQPASPPSDPARYTFRSMGVSVSATPVGFSQGGGIWNEMPPTRRFMTPRDFGGGLELSAASVIGDRSVTSVTLMPTGDVPLFIPNFRTGPSFSPGAGTYRGPFTLDSGVSANGRAR